MRYIGTLYNNTWWENVLIAILVIVGFIMSCFSMVQMAAKIGQFW